MEHLLDEELLRRRVRVLVVGCGGTGSAFSSGLPYLHHAMVARGHPAGLEVTVVDGDTISPANCARQPFGSGEVGLFKAVVLVNRINLFWGLDWKALPEHLNSAQPVQHADIVVGCVDTRAARLVIHQSVSSPAAWVRLWLDLGNGEESGQFVLGQPLNGVNRRRATRLRTIAELFPEAITPSLEDHDLPSCSALEGIEKQHPFINQVLAQHALALLGQLFRYGRASYHGGFVSLASGTCAPIRIDPKTWKRIRGRQKAEMARKGNIPSRHN
jgi:PRTRC genetic system ThiF family protein